MLVVKYTLQTMTSVSKRRTLHPAASYAVCHHSAVRWWCLSARLKDTRTLK